jgi:hypothetical protein
MPTSDLISKKNNHGKIFGQQHYQHTFELLSRDSGILKLGLLFKNASSVLQLSITDSGEAGSCVKTGYT